MKGKKLIDRKTLNWLLRLAIWEGGIESRVMDCELEGLAQDWAYRTGR